MRRALLTSVTVGGIVLGAAAPAAADPPERFRESGPYQYLYSASEDCREQGGDRTVCSNVTVDAFTISDDLIAVCVSTATYVFQRERFTLRSEEFGCTEVAASALTVTDGLEATLAPTTVTLTSGGKKGGSREVTVSAQDSPIGDITTVSGRTSFRDGNCSYRSSFTEQSAEVAGTITLDDVTLEEFGFAGTGEARTTEVCR
jgi:hypothetical protein